MKRKPQQLLKKLLTLTTSDTEALENILNIAVKQKESKR